MELFYIWAVIWIVVGACIVLLAWQLLRMWQGRSKAEYEKALETAKPRHKPALGEGLRIPAKPILVADKGTTFVKTDNPPHKHLYKLTQTLDGPKIKIYRFDCGCGEHTYRSEKVFWEGPKEKTLRKQLNYIFWVKRPANFTQMLRVIRTQDNSRGGTIDISGPIRELGYPSWFKTVLSQTLEEYTGVGTEEGLNFSFVEWTENNWSGCRVTWWISEWDRKWKGIRKSV